MVTSSLRQSLCCPLCRLALTEGSGVFVCTGCATVFPIVDGIPSLCIEPVAIPGEAELDLTVMILSKDEEYNIARTLTEARRVLDDIGMSYEILVVDGGSKDGTQDVAITAGARLHVQQKSGYGNAFREGLELVRGRYLLTLDADLSHDPNYIQLVWAQRDSAELIVGSRYTPGGEERMPVLRSILSRLLNGSFGFLLSMPVADLSSGFRLYKSSVLKSLQLEGRDFDILVELLVKLYLEGYRVIELPMFYKPRGRGHSKVRWIQFVLSYLSGLWRLFRLRNSVQAADYDSRAYHSVLPPQRYWQRHRYAIVLRFIGEQTSGILDVGCGSSKIIQSLPGAVGSDFLLRKLRYLRKIHPQLVHASIFDLPFQDASFETVVCSQVIEHIPNTERAMAELVRVLKPGGRLILGTPDYGTLNWRIIEPIYEKLIPGGYAGEHITNLNRLGLHELLERHGIDLLEEAYVGGGEWIGLGKKR